MKFVTTFFCAKIAKPGENKHLHFENLRLRAITKRILGQETTLLSLR